MNGEITFSSHSPPLCGWQWFSQHQHDYTQEQIDALGIQVSCAGVRYSTITGERKRGMVKNLVKANR